MPPQKAAIDLSAGDTPPIDLSAGDVPPAPQPSLIDRLTEITGMASALDSWHHVFVPKSKDRDFFVTARRVVEQAIGEQMDGTPLPDPNAGKNPAACCAR